LIALNLRTHPALGREIKNELKTITAFAGEKFRTNFRGYIGKCSGVESYEAVRIATFKQGLAASMPVLDEPENL
jgi:hypothetical protein